MPAPIPEVPTAQVDQSDGSLGGDLRPKSQDCAGGAHEAAGPVAQTNYNPFISHDFLSALEGSGSVRSRAGWQPMHLLAQAGKGAMMGSVPATPNPIPRANTCSTTAGPRLMNAPAAATIRNCRSPCLSRRRPGAACWCAPDRSRRWCAAALADGLTEIVAARTPPRSMSLFDRAGMGAVRDARLSEAHPSAIPLGKRRLQVLRCLPRRAFLAQAQDHPSRTRRCPANGHQRAWFTGKELTESVWDAFFAFYMETGSRKG